MAIDATTELSIPTEQASLTEALLERLWRGGTFGYYWTPDGDPWTKDGKEISTKWSNWMRAAQIRPPIPAWLDKNLYFGVHPCISRGFDSKRPANKQRAVNAIIEAINCFFSEFDGKDFVRPDEYAPYLPQIENEHEAIDAARKAAFAVDPALYKARAWAHIQALPLTPSVSIDSGGGFQLYHLLADTVQVTDENRAHIANIQAAWVKLVSGDQQAKDLSRVLRLPGTRNLKPQYGPNFPVVTVIAADFERLYTLEQFEAITEGIRIDQSVKTARIGYTNGNGVNHTDTYESAVDALRRLSPWRCDDRAEWIRIGSALKSALGEEGLTLWDQWSQGSHKYKDGDCSANWRSILPDKRTLGTLIWCANEDNPRPKSNDDIPIYEFGFVLEMPEPLDLEQLDPPKPAKHHSWPYAVESGRMVFLKEDKDGEIIHLPIADWTASITEEIIDEDGAKTFTVEGVAVRGGAFRVEIDANLFGEGARMRAQLEGAAGALDPIRTRMGEHVGPAIKLLTKQDELSVVRRFRRTGWHDGIFLLPGRTDHRIELPGKLPYGVNSNYDIKDGLTALDALLGSVNPSITTAVIALLLQAPLHRLAGWQNERYGMFIQGRTGSLKTSFAQAAMCIYGAGFADDTALIKWGEGATRNAIMGYATHAHDMPLLIDNYKPNTGGGFNDFVNLIHNILEGGDKDRLNRNSQIRAARAVHCFPLITGEDIPDSDPASLARLLLVTFEWQRGAPNDRLSIAQASPDALATIGAAWIDWLEQPDTQQLITEEASQLHAIRSRWAQHLRTLRSDMVNVLRVATNLATSELTWRIAELHPTLGSMFSDYSADHNRGLYAIADRMAIRTAEALEAQQFLSALRDLLASGQCALVHRSSPDATANKEKDHVIGWYDTDGVYLLPTMAINAVKRITGQTGIQISTQALYGQLEGLELLAEKGREKTTKPTKINGQLYRVLHLKPEALIVKDDETTAEEAAILEGNTELMDAIAGM